MFVVILTWSLSSFHGLCHGRANRCPGSPAWCVPPPTWHLRPGLLLPMRLSFPWCSGRGLLCSPNLIKSLDWISFVPCDLVAKHHRLGALKQQGLVLSQLRGHQPGIEVSQSRTPSSLPGSLPAPDVVATLGMPGLQVRPPSAPWPMALFSVAHSCGLCTRTPSCWVQAHPIPMCPA